MIVTPIKTHTITNKDKSIFEILDQYMLCHPEQSEGSHSIDSHPRPDRGSAQSDSRLRENDLIKRDSSPSVQNDKMYLSENSVLAVTSKIVAILEGSVAPLTTDKERLIQEEAEYYLPRSSSKYDVQFTIKNNILSANAGVDESNADNQYVLWPKDPQKSANEIREHVRKAWGIKNVGVIITDSKATPLRWGVTGIALSHSGFNALKDYIGTEDLFGRKFHFEKLNIADSLASSAVLAMGEGAEQTPMALITGIPNIEFVDRNPTKEELRSLVIDPKDDLYAPLLTSVKWEKGRK